MSIDLITSLPDALNGGDDKRHSHFCRGLSNSTLAAPQFHCNLGALLGRKV